jgi:RimJ/RimL family protein N-acetyltransferase
MIVRRARLEDARAMAMVIAEVATEGFLGSEAPVDVDERAQRFRRTIEEEGPSAEWVLEDGEQIVGDASVRERVPGVLTVGMAILPEARGRGAGRAMLATILDHAHACGAHKLDLEVWTDNFRAIALYGSAGFEVEGLRRDHYRRGDGSLRSTLIMGRLLRGQE